jgi:hypothetical protein
MPLMLIPTATEAAFRAQKVHTHAAGYWAQAAQGCFAVRYQRSSVADGILSSLPTTPLAAPKAGTRAHNAGVLLITTQDISGCGNLPTLWEPREVLHISGGGQLPACCNAIGHEPLKSA